MQDIRLRDKRKPGHCWQDNELYDTFQPIIGAMAVLVYVQMTRECYGTTVRASLRELAAAARISKDSVQRSLGVMELIGMVRVARAGDRQAATYELADLKELAIHYGAAFDARRSSYQLSAAQAETLIFQVREFLAKKRQKSVSLGDRELAPAPVQITLQGDSSVSLVGQSVSPLGDRTVSQEGQPLIQDSKQQQDSRQLAPYPLPAGGGARSDLDEAVDRVMEGCSFTDPRIRAAIAGQAELHLARGEPAGDIARRMIEAWRIYVEEGRFLRYTWSPAKFWAQGHWVNWEGWPIDQSLLQRWRDARVGT